MTTKFNVGDRVYLETIVEEISIDKNGATFKIVFRNYDGKVCTTWVREGQINAET